MIFFPGGVAFGVRSVLRELTKLAKNRINLSIRILLFTAIAGIAWAQCPYSCPFEIQCQGLCDTQFGDPADPCLYAATGGCRQGQDRRGNCCCDPTPILIDVDSSGLRLSSAAQGVPFLINGPIAVMTPWPMLGSSNGWLALDRNGNGLIDSGSELFGGVTPQREPPPGQARNGFFALAEFDRLANGGNGDGTVSAEDAIWPRLREFGRIETATEFRRPENWCRFKRSVLLR